MDVFARGLVQDPELILNLTNNAVGFKRVDALNIKATVVEISQVKLGLKDLESATVLVAAASPVKAIFLIENFCCQKVITFPMKPEIC